MDVNETLCSETETRPRLLAFNLRRGRDRELSKLFEMFDFRFETKTETFFQDFTYKRTVCFSRFQHG